MNPRARAVVVSLAGAVVFAVLLAAFAKLPPFGVYLGPYGTFLNAVAPHERRIANIITAVNFDYRGLDTMGEEFILFAAVAGITLVLRRDRAQTTDDPLPAARGRTAGHRSDALGLFALAGIGATVAFGWYMAVHPQLTPGGGFQGGAITAGFVLVLFFGFGYRPFKRVAPAKRTETVEAIGAAGYVAVGVATLVASGVFLANILPLGTSGSLFSTGMIPIINLFVAIEVLAGFIVMFAEFIDETRVERDEPENESAA